MDLCSTVLALLEVVGAVAFAYLSTLFLRIYVRLKSDELLAYTTSFILLALSQVCSLLSTIVSEGRLAATLYVATSSLAMAGFMVMLFPRRSSKFYMLVPLLVTTPDMLAGLVSTILVIRSVRGRTRSFLAILSLSYYVRGLSIVLSSAQGSLLGLLVSETLRAFAAILMSLHHMTQVLTHEQEEK
ncbi:MAG: hypothetical protein QW705_01300 [Zestosphaera sp.]